MKKLLSVLLVSLLSLAVFARNYIGIIYPLGIGIESIDVNGYVEDEKSLTINDAGIGLEYLYELDNHFTIGLDAYVQTTENLMFMKNNWTKTVYSFEYKGLQYNIMPMFGYSIDDPNSKHGGIGQVFIIPLGISTMNFTGYKVDADDETITDKTIDENYIRLRTGLRLSYLWGLGKYFKFGSYLGFDVIDYGTLGDNEVGGELTLGLRLNYCR